MELVKGVPITRYCDEHQLTPRQRLELFVPVCQAVQHAHQKGIIHRDLKPSNVLVACYDGKPVPKVIDFGVAKATGQQLTEQTLCHRLRRGRRHAGVHESGAGRVQPAGHRHAQRRLQPGRAAVRAADRHDAAGEEAVEESGDAGSAADHPRGGAAATEHAVEHGGGVCRRIAASRGLEPKKLSGVVRGELDWIVMKALEKDRGRRYETANGLALDVQRYLADEPVQACPPSAAYRLRKFARRNKALLTALTVIAATLLLAGATVTWKWWEAEQAKGKVEGALNETQQAEKRAKQGEGRATAAERQSRLREAEALVGEAHGIRYSRRPGQRFESLAALDKGRRHRPRAGPAAGVVRPACATSQSPLCAARRPHHPDVGRFPAGHAPGRGEPRLRAVCPHHPERRLFGAAHRR